MNIIFYIVLSVAISTPFFFLYWIIRSKAGKIAGRFRTLYGEDLILLTGCGIVTGLSRVPGVLGLLHDRIVYESTILSERGEIPFQEIVKIALEDTKRSKHRRARKYRNAKVLEINTGKGRVNLFAIPLSKAGVWENALSEVME